MSVQSFSLEPGKEFVGNLVWSGVPGDSKKAQHEHIRKLAESDKFDLLVQRTGSTAQIGYAFTSDGYRIGMLSIAAMLSKSVEMLRLGRNVVCAIRIPNDRDARWIYFAQQDGLTVGDQIASEHEVRQLMLEAVSRKTVEYDNIIAPLTWHIHAARADLSFDDFLPPKQQGGKFSRRKETAGLSVAYKSWWELRPLNAASSTPWLKIAAVACLLLAAGGALGWKHWRNEKAKAELAAFVKEQQEAAQRALAAASQKPPPKMPDHPWKTKPHALEFAQACRNAFFSLPHVWPAGWEFREATCVGNSLAVVWTRPPGGRVDYFREIQPGATFTPDFKTATVVIALKTTWNLEDEEAPAGRQRASRLEDLNEVHGWKMSLSEVAQPPIEPPTVSKKSSSSPPAVASWTEQKWGIQKLSLPVLATLEQLDDKGFRVDSIQTKLAGGLFYWNIEGVQYGSP